MSDETSVIPVSKPVRQLKISCHNCMQKLDVTSFPSFARFQCPVCGTELIVPTWFDTYLLEEQGGSGGMATVYRALDPALDREVAIKVLKPEISDDPERVDLFLHEARAAATINHFAVVPIYTCGVFEGQAYIVMQYMGGGSLDQQLRQAQENLPVRTVASWIRDIAEGLENAKDHGVIHHDVKPGNILLDSEGKAKIGDFGIAQIVRSGGKSDSSEELIQDIAGSWLSPHYVSPEKVRTGKEGFEGDIYSLGATFYHLLTGVPPFSHENVEELLRMRLSEQPLPPHLHRPDVGMGLSRLIMAMMSKSPSDRPSYRIIIASLNRIIKESAESTAVLPSRKSGDDDPARPQDSKSASGVLHRYKRIALLAAGSLLLFVLLAAGAGRLFYTWRQSLPDTPSSSPEDTERTVQNSELDPNPEITLSLACGDLDSALVYADVTASDSSLPLKKRTTALFQAACALYLAAVEDPQSEIRRRLSELEKSIGTENEGEILSLLTGIRLLAGIEVKTSENLSGKVEAERLAAQCFFSAKELLSSSAEAGFLPRRIDFLEKALSLLPPGSWLSAAWEKHISAWRQTVLQRSGKKEEVEPLFARLIVKTGEWADKPAFSPKSFSDSFDLFSAFEISEDNDMEKVPDFSADALKRTSEKYLKFGRPIPDAPDRISGSGIRQYLKKIPEELQPDEDRRCRLMCQIRPYIAETAAGSAYQADELTLTDQTVLGEGEALFNEQYLVYRIRREDGQFENRRLTWDQIPAHEMLTILLYYITYRGNAALSSENVGSSTVRKLADAFLRYAVFAQWYGYYDEAAKAAGKARDLLPGSHIDKYIEHLLLR